MACGPWAAITSRKRAATVPMASSQVIRSKRPSPFGPTRFEGWRMRSGL